MDSRLVETAGGRTKVRVYEGGSGPPLLFLPGGAGLFPDDSFLAALAARHRVADGRPLPPRDREARARGARGPLARRAPDPGPLRGDALRAPGPPLPRRRARRATARPRPPERGAARPP